MDVSLGEAIKWLFTFQLIFQSQILPLHSAIDASIVSCDPFDSPAGYRGPNDVSKNDHFDCIKDGPINCPPGSNCNIYCEEDVPNIKSWNANMTNSLGVTNDSCSGVTINCPDNAYCYIDCIYSCNGMIVNAESSTHLEIYRCGTESNGCDNMTIWCPQTNAANPTPICNFSGVSITNSINGLNIHSQQSFSEISLNTLNLIGNNNIMHCGPTATDYNCTIDPITKSQCQNSLGACQDYILTSSPTRQPTPNPTANPTITPTNNPTNIPSISPLFNPSTSPTIEPTISSINPTYTPTIPTYIPTIFPTKTPTFPSLSPTNNPSKIPSISPTNVPTLSPTYNPTKKATLSPTLSPTLFPTKQPTITPTISPTGFPTLEPTLIFTTEGIEDDDSQSSINVGNRMLITIIGVIVICFLTTFVICFCMYLCKKYKYEATEILRIKTNDHGIQLGTTSPTGDNQKSTSQQMLRVTSVSHIPDTSHIADIYDTSEPVMVTSIMGTSVRSLNEPDLPPEPKSLADSIDLPPEPKSLANIHAILLANKSSKRLEGMHLNTLNLIENGQIIDNEEIIVTRGSPEITPQVPQADKLYDEQMIVVKKYNNMNNLKEDSQSDEIYERYDDTNDNINTATNMATTATPMDELSENKGKANELIDYDYNDDDDDQINIVDIIGNDVNNNLNVMIEKRNYLGRDELFKD